LGGGGFLILSDASTRQIMALNFRERAPQQLKWQAFEPGGSRTGWQAVGIPGAVAGLEEAHRRWGRLPRQRLLQPALDLAEKGHVVDDELEKRLRQRRVDLEKDPELRALFFPGGKPLRAGDRLVQKGLAKTLKGLSRKGPSYFYRGGVAKSAVRASRVHGGFLTPNDFSTVRAQDLAVLHLNYHGYDLYTIDLPSSGGLVLFETLNTWSLLHPKFDQKWSFGNISLLARAMAEAFADRAAFLGDPKFSKVDRDLFLNPERAREKAQRILSNRRTLDSAKTSGPQGQETSHLVVVDAQGNAVSLTNSLNTSFGAAVAIPGTGVILNNTIDDFSFPDQSGNAYGLTGGRANWPEARKMPLSSMTPTLVMENEQLKIVLGSPGGPRIISTVLLTLVGLIDFDFSLDQVLSQGRFHQQAISGPLFLEQDGFSSETRKGLQRRGHILKTENPWGNLQILLRTSKGWSGASDLRGRGESAGF